MEAAVAQSLIAALAANTAAVTENSRLLVEAAGGRERVLAAAAAASAPKPSTRTKKADEAPAAEAAAEAETPAAETTAPAAAAKPQPDLNDPLNKAIAEFVGGTDRAEERAARVARVQDLFGRVGATGGAATVPDDKRQAFINTLKKDLENGDLCPAEPVEETL
jgi:hypothetical protein